MNINELEINSIELGQDNYLLNMKNGETVPVHYNAHNVSGLIALLNRRNIELS